MLKLIDGIERLNINTLWAASSPSPRAHERDILSLFLTHRAVAILLIVYFIPRERARLNRPLSHYSGGRLTLRPETILHNSNEAPF